MTDWLTPACQLLERGSPDALAIACGVLVALLVALIALGFGPLRPWLGLTGSRENAAAGCEDGALGAWSLYRQLRGPHGTTGAGGVVGGTGPEAATRPWKRHRPLLVPDLRPMVVRDDVVGRGG